MLYSHPQSIFRDNLVVIYNMRGVKGVETNMRTGKKHIGEEGFEEACWEMAWDMIQQMMIEKLEG